jgi:hypothetical protein
MATLLKMQNPIGDERRAWWPGGRTRANPSVSTARIHPAEARRFPRRCASKRVLIQPDLCEDRVDGVDVRAVVNPLDLKAFGFVSVDEPREAVKESLESVWALCMGVTTG